MRKLPFLAKVTLSSLIAYSMCKKLWDNNVYEVELYEVALRYRDRYDKTLEVSPSSNNIVNSTDEQLSNQGEGNK